MTFLAFSEHHLQKLDTTTDDDEGDHHAKNMPTFPLQHHSTTNNENNASPSREVSPKFVVAGKKYGRRSRPPSEAFENWSSDSDTETGALDSNRLRSSDQEQMHSTPKNSPNGTQKVSSGTRSAKGHYRVN